MARRLRLSILLAIAVVLAVLVVNRLTTEPSRPAPVATQKPSAMEQAAPLLGLDPAEVRRMQAVTERLQRLIRRVEAPATAANAQVLFCLAAHHASPFEPIRAEVARSLLLLAVKDRENDQLVPAVRRFLANTVIAAIDSGGDQVAELASMILLQFASEPRLRSQLDWPSAFAVLRRAFAQRDDVTRSVVAHAIGQLAEAARPCAPWLVDFAREHAGSTRTMALSALAETGLAAAELRSLAETWTAMDRDARLGLLRLAARHPADPVACAEVLTRALREADRPVRCLAAMLAVDFPEQSAAIAHTSLRVDEPVSRELAVGRALLAERAGRRCDLAAGEDPDLDAVLDLVCRDLREPGDGGELARALEPWRDRDWYSWEEYAVLRAAADALAIAGRSSRAAELQARLAASDVFEDDVWLKESQQAR